MPKKEEKVKFFFTGGVAYEGEDYGPDQPGGQLAEVDPFHARQFQARGKGAPYDPKKHKVSKPGSKKGGDADGDDPPADQK